MISQEGAPSLNVSFQITRVPMVEATAESSNHKQSKTSRFLHSSQAEEGNNCGSQMFLSNPFWSHSPLSHLLSSTGVHAPNFGIRLAWWIPVEQFCKDDLNGLAILKKFPMPSQPTRGQSSSLSIAVLRCRVG